MNIGTHNIMTKTNLFSCDILLNGNIEIFESSLVNNVKNCGYFCSNFEELHMKRKKHVLNSTRASFIIDYYFHKIWTQLKQSSVSLCWWINENFQLKWKMKQPYEKHTERKCEYRTYTVYAEWAYTSCFSYCCKSFANDFESRISN